MKANTLLEVSEFSVDEIRKKLQDEEDKLLMKQAEFDWNIESGKVPAGQFSRFNHYEMGLITESAAVLINKLTKERRWVAYNQMGL